MYYTAFKFQEEEISTTSHYILHITKSHRGFDLIKQIYNDFANVGTIFDEKNTYLTKRAERMAEYFQNHTIPDNVWLGVTVEAKSSDLENY